MGPSKNKTQGGAGRALSPVTDSVRVATVDAKGDVDCAGIEACDFMLAQAAEQVPNAVLDLSDATYIDYRATPILVARRRIMKARGGEFVIAAGRAEVRNILRAAVGSEIPVFVTMDEAMSYINGETELVGVGASRSARKPRAVKR